MLTQENTKTPLEKTSQNSLQQFKLYEEIEGLKKQEEILINKRKQQPYKITIGEMSQSTRYNKLKTESKHLQNIIK